MFLQVIFLRAAHGQELAVAPRGAFSGVSIFFRAGQILTRDGARRSAMISAGVPAATISPAMDARARADVHDIIRRAHRVLVVLDDDQRSCRGRADA